MNNYSYQITPGSNLYLFDRPINKLPYRKIQTGEISSLSLTQLLWLALGLTDVENDFHSVDLKALAEAKSVRDITRLLPINHLQATRLLAVIYLGRKLNDLASSQAVDK